jgi:hypothetical protein
MMKKSAVISFQLEFTVCGVEAGSGVCRPFAEATNEMPGKKDVLFFRLFRGSEAKRARLYPDQAQDCPLLGSKLTASIFSPCLVSAKPFSPRFCIGAFGFLKETFYLPSEYQFEIHKLDLLLKMLVPQPKPRGLATSFPLFGALPKELRSRIWIDALPGPRIIYVQRHPFNKEEDEKGEADRQRYIQEPTYFRSPAPMTWSHCFCGLVQKAAP